MTFPHFTSTSTSTAQWPPFPIPWQQGSLDPVVKRVGAYVTQMGTYASTAPQPQHDEPPNFDAAPDFLVNHFTAVARRLHHPDIDRLANNMPVVIKNEEDRKVVYDNLPYLFEAVIDALAQYEELSIRETGHGRPEESYYQAKLHENANPTLRTTESQSFFKLVIGMAAAEFGYKGPENRSHAARDIQAHLNRLGMHLDEKTIRKCLGQAWARLIDKNRPIPEDD